MPTVGRYTLVSRIGLGGMAEVWRATAAGAAGFEKTFAIKRILPEYTHDPQFVQMFVSEAKLAQRLESANVVRVIDFGEDDDGGYYLVMEYVNGRNVAAILDRIEIRRRTVPLAVVVHVGIEAAKGLGAAHRLVDESGRPLDLVHRDVSPHNILVSWQGEVKISDFGIAKAGSVPSVTRTGIRKGKIHYMSPEQAIGEPLDDRSDVYSLGLVLYELATFKRFLNDTSFPRLSERLLRREDATEEELALLPEVLREILDRALKGNRDDRYASAAELEAALLRIEPRGDVLPREQLHELLLDVFDEDERSDAAPRDTASGVPAAQLAASKLVPTRQLPEAEPISQDSLGQTRVSQALPDPLALIQFTNVMPSAEDPGAASGSTVRRLEQSSTERLSDLRGEPPPDSATWIAPRKPGDAPIQAPAVLTTTRPSATASPRNRTIVAAGALAVIAALAIFLGFVVQGLVRR